MTNAVNVALAVAAVAGVSVFALWWRFRPRRPREQGFEFVYVNQDGSARELSPDERVYLSTEFPGGDGGQPSIKGRYESRDGWGSQSGFIERRMVPSRITIEPVDPDYDAAEKGEDDILGAFRASGFKSATNADGSVEFTADPGMSRKQGLEQMRSHYLATQRRREELARATRPR